MGIPVQEKNYYSLHGIWGAYASLVLGKIGEGAGIAVGNVQPPMRSLFVGYCYGTEKPLLLPFFPAASARPFKNASDNPGIPTRSFIASQEYSVIEDKELMREVSISGETWCAGLVSMKVTSFFGQKPDPASTDFAILKAQLCPVLYITLSFDNRQGVEPLVGIFGMQDIRRPLSDITNGSLRGFAHGTDWGFATASADDVTEVMDWRVVPAVFSGNCTLCRLASEGALRFLVKPGEIREYIIAVGVYRGGTVTSGERMYAYYANLFEDLENVLRFAIDNASAALEQAALLDAELDQALLSKDRKFLIAHAIHSYCANTELLVTENGSPVFVVNEGEYQMMNTQDLTIDQAYFELCYSPWTVRNELDFSLAHAAYTDSFGLAFAHDLGIADCFAPIGTSVYELSRLSGCYSYMTYEETANWLLTACLYVHHTQDGKWYRKHKDALIACFESLHNRDRNNDGIMDADSDRCAGGMEITTYDSLDASLGQARNNLYLAVKTWAAYVCVSSLFRRYEKPVSEYAKRAHDLAQQTARTIQSWMLEKEGYIPAVFESGNRSKIIPAVEGLVYPYLSGDPEAVQENGPFGSFVQALKRHLESVLVPGVCLDTISGGWKLSSTSRNTWLSKIFLNQFVAETILGMRDDRTMRDAIHAKWLRSGSAQWAATDQVDASDGQDLGSRLYPRLVTSILWLKYS
jgi:hypothetical protein